jgi:hypothetical protein
MNDAQAVAGKPPGVSGEQKAAAAAKAASEGKTEGSGELLEQRIAVAAYYRSERRNFEPGHELEDWLDAEAELRAEMEGLKGFPA